MKNRLLSAGSLLLLAVPAMLWAQPREFGAATYTPPTGWNYDAQPAFHTMMRARGADMCVMGVTTSEPAPAALDAAFARSWSTVFNTASYRSAPQPAMRVQTSPAGFRHAVGEGELVNNNNQRLIARLHVFPIGESAQSVILVVNSRNALESCRSDWETFFASLRFSVPSPPAAATPTGVASGTRPDSTVSTPAAVATRKSGGGPMTFDNMVFTPPAGWTVEQTTASLTMTPADTRGGEALRVLLLPGKRSTGNLRQEFEQTWSEVRSSLGAQQLMSVNGVPFELKEPGRSPRGWEYLQGSGALRVANGQWSVEIYVMMAADRVERVVVLSSDFRNSSGLMMTTLANPRYDRAIRQLVFTLQFSNLAAVAIPPTSLGGTGIIGVWHGVAMSFGSLKPHFAIFFDNGVTFFGPNFPGLGLLGIDASVEAPRSPRYWGRYAFQNGSGTITMPYGTIPMRLNGADLTLKTNNTDHRFGRLPALEARHIEGTWCLESGQCLRFISGGRFEDSGAARIVEHPTYAFPETPERGQGQYEVRDFTLILRYDGGPEIRIALLALAGTATAPRLLLSFNVDVLTRR